MFVSTEKKVIYIHPTHTGGGYFWRVYGRYWDGSFEEMAAALPNYPGTSTHHMSRRELENYFPGDLDDYKFIATIRNPWERYYRMYCYHLVRRDHHDSWLATTAKGFEEFLIRVASGEGDWLVGPQLDFLTSQNGNVNFDYLVQFENLEADTY